MGSIYNSTGETSQTFIHKPPPHQPELTPVMAVIHVINGSRAVGVLFKPMCHFCFTLPCLLEFRSRMTFSSVVGLSNYSPTQCVLSFCFCFERITVFTPLIIFSCILPKVSAITVLNKVQIQIRNCLL